MWRMVHQENGILRRQGLRAGARGDWGGWLLNCQPWVCDSHLGTCVVTGSAQFAWSIVYSFIDSFIKFSKYLWNTYYVWAKPGFGKLTLEDQIRPYPLLYISSKLPFALHYNAELNSCDRDGIACKAKNIYYMALYRDSLLTSVLGRGTSKCKSSEARICQAYLRKSKEVIAIGVEWARGKVERPETLEEIGKSSQVGSYKSCQGLGSSYQWGGDHWRVEIRGMHSWT